MSYFSDESYDREDIIKKRKKTKELTKEQLIEILSNTYSTYGKSDLERLSIDELKEMKKQSDELEKKYYNDLEDKYFKRYGNHERARLYEHQDNNYEEENTNGLGR